MKEVTFKKEYKAPDKVVYPEGSTAKVTDKQAVWLAANGFTEAAKKENKQAKNRETK